jgi:L-lactate dehydrogenase complex protein LldG
VAASVNAREEILDRIRRTNARRAVSVPRDYRGPGHAEVDDIVDLFVERVDDYRASVHRCAAPDAPDTIAAILQRTGRRIVVPPGFPAELLRDADLDPVYDEPPLTAPQLDATAGVITTCAVGIATTGTIVLDHRAGQGRRALTLVPDHHLVVVHAEQIVAAVPDAVALLDPVQPQTWVSGPSATSDIELQRVEGVHGPRNLDVVVVD